MNEKTYKIKGLAWVECMNHGSREVHCAKTNLNEYLVVRDIQGCFIITYDKDILDVESIEDGKEKAEADWFARILPALEEVKEGE